MRNLDKKTVGRWLKSARLSRGLTQYEFAAATKMSQAKVSKVESGVSNVTLREMARTLKYLKLGWNTLNGAR